MSLIIEEGQSASSVQPSPRWKTALCELFSEYVIGDNSWATITTCASLLGGTTSVILLDSLLHTIADNCYEAEATSQEAFGECNAPYVSSLLIYSYLLGGSCFVFGFMTQRCVRREIEGGSRCREAVLTVQQKCLYEICLCLIYLYNGFFIKVNDRETFYSFLACGSAGVGIASGFFGIYMRERWEEFLQDEPRIQTETPWNPIVRFSLFGANIAAIVGAALSGSIKGRQIILNMAVLLQARQVGRELSYLGVTRAASPLRSLLDMRAAIVAAGWVVYLRPASTASKLAGLLMVGLATRHAECEKKRRTYAPFASLATEEGVKKVAVFCREYWKTMGLLAFMGVLQGVPFLDCEGHPNPWNFTCPIGWEVSGYVAGNQLVLEGEGVTIAIASGLAQFYLRQLSVTFSGRAPRLCKTYVDWTDRYQGFLISMIPYAVIESEKTQPAYGGGVYTFNPPAPLVLLGMTMGTAAHQRAYRQTDGEYDELPD